MEEAKMRQSKEGASHGHGAAFSFRSQLVPLMISATPQPGIIISETVSASKCPVALS